MKIAIGAAATVVLIVLISGTVFVGILGNYLQDDILTEAAGDRLTILMGMELRFSQNSNDYLVFGFDRDYLMTHRDIHRMGIGNYIRMAREDGLLTIQAHPFRNGMTVTDPRPLPQ